MYETREYAEIFCKGIFRSFTTKVFFLSKSSISAWILIVFFQWYGDFFPFFDKNRVFCLVATLKPTFKNIYLYMLGGGGGVNALGDASAKNASFFYGIPKRVLSWQSKDDWRINKA